MAIKKHNNKTVTMSAQVAVSKSECGMDYVQVMPDNPRTGQVSPFHGMGYGQMLNNGTFDFVRKKRIRRKPDLKLPHSSLSFGSDGWDRYILTLPSEQRGNLSQILNKEANIAGAFANHDVWGMPFSVDDLID